MADIAERTGARVTRVEAEWGRAIEPVAVKEALARVARPRLVAIVHGETSTGVHQPLEKIAKLARAAGALFLVDAVTTIGGAEIRMDAWGIDALYGGSQKCLSAPPGLAPVSLGPRAVTALEARKSRVQSWYLDLTLLRKYWGPEKVYHHTPAEPLYCALREALRLVLDEGVEARCARHERNQRALEEGLEALGFHIVAPPGLRLPMLTVVRPPGRLEAPAIQRALLEEYSIEVAGGLGPFAGKVLRCGLMGATSTRENVDLLLDALKRIVKR